MIPNQMAGTFQWVWEVDACGGASGIIAKAQQTGSDGVIVKFANGSLAGDPVSQKFMSDFTAIIPVLKKAGLKVGGWIYSYLTDVDGEVATCVQAASLGADFLVIDAEAEVEGKNTAVVEFGQKLRAKLPNMPLGLSTFAIANYHAQVPMKEYSAFVDVMMPQIYWATMGWTPDYAFNLSVASFQQFGKPIAPTGQSYDSATPADMARFVQLCKQAGFTHLSWWDMQSASADQLKAIGANLIPAPKSQPVAPAIASDVSVDSWYAPAVKYVLAEGIMHNNADGTFNPDKPITRAELAQVIFNITHQGK